MKTTYIHIVRNKSNGTAFSRHRTIEAAIKAACRHRWLADYPEVIDYSTEYWNNHK